jgi:hypothetical protein
MPETQTQKKAKIPEATREDVWFSRKTKPTATIPNRYATICEAQMAVLYVPKRSKNWSTVKGSFMDRPFCDD